MVLNRFILRIMNLRFLWSDLTLQLKMFVSLQCVAFSCYVEKRFRPFTETRLKGERKECAFSWSIGFERLRVKVKRFGNSAHSFQFQLTRFAFFSSFHSWAESWASFMSAIVQRESRKFFSLSSGIFLLLRHWNERWNGGVSFAMCC